MIVRRMTESDRAAIGELYAASWKAGYAGLLPKIFLDALEPRKYEERSLENGFLDAGSFVAVEDGKVVAHCHARPADEPQMRDPSRAGSWGEIHTLYTHPDYWGRGFGTAVFQYAEKWLNENGFANAYLYVLEGNKRAERFYKAHGYFPNGDTLCCEVGGVIVTDYRYVKRL